MEQLKEKFGNAGFEDNAGVQSLSVAAQTRRGKCAENQENTLQVQMASQSEGYVDWLAININ